MFSATPTVFHERSPLLVSMWTRVRAGGGVFAVEDAHFVINQVESLDGGVMRQQGFAQGQSSA
jgi:hypothetical protein